jgi:hypothetical protein
MNTNDKHQALRQALTPIEPKRLPSNFAYTTLQRICHEQRKRERRQRIVDIAVIIAVSLFGVGPLVYAFGTMLWQSLAAMLTSIELCFRQPGALSLVLSTLFCLVFFTLLNHWLSRHYGSGITHNSF